MVKPLSAQLADLSVRAKNAEDAVAAAQKEAHGQASQSSLICLTSFHNPHPARQNALRCERLACTGILIQQRCWSPSSATAPSNVRFGSLADIAKRMHHVCFTFKSGHAHHRQVFAHVLITERVGK